MALALGRGGCNRGAMVQLPPVSIGLRGLQCALEFSVYLFIFPLLLKNTH